MLCSSGGIASASLSFADCRGLSFSGREMKFWLKHLSPEPKLFSTIPKGLMRFHFYHRYPAFMSWPCQRFHGDVTWGQTEIIEFGPRVFSINLIWLWMLQVNVALPSGLEESFSIPQSSKVGDLKVLAQRSLGRFLRLVTTKGETLHPSEPLQATGLQNGDTLTAIAQPVIAATCKAFALWSCGGDGILGGILFVAATALQSNINWMCRFRPTMVLSLRSWWMDQWLRGVIQSGAVIAPPSKISSRVYGRFPLHRKPLRRSSEMAQLWHGVIQAMVVTALKSKIG